MLRRMTDGEADEVHAAIDAGEAHEVPGASFDCPGSLDARVTFWLMQARVLRCEDAGDDHLVEVMSGDELEVFARTYGLESRGLGGAVK